MLRHQKKSYNDKRKSPFLESEHLRQEIEDLEDALILHARFQSESDNSVKEMIRKELGTTRWEHGGEGKLTTYRSGKDLCNQEMRVHRFAHKKTKDMNKQHTVSSDNDDDRPKRDKENSDALMCASADRKIRKLKKTKSTLDNKELKDITSDVEKMSVLKITSIRATTTSNESHEITSDTADVKQEAILKIPSLKDEASANSQEKSVMKKTNNYSSNLHLNIVDKKHRKSSSHNSKAESSKAIEVPRADVKVVHTKSVSQLFIQDNCDNFTSGTQPSFNSRGTNNIITNIKLNTQELDGRVDTDKTLKSEIDNHINKSDTSKNTFVNELLYNETEWSRSKTLGNVNQNRNSNDDPRFLSSTEDHKVDNKDKWAVRNKGVVFMDSDCIQVPCDSSCTDDGCGDLFTDFDALKDQQDPLQDSCELACLSDEECFEKHTQQKEMNEKMLSCKDHSNMVSTIRKTLSTVQSSVPSLTNNMTFNVNTNLDENMCFSYGQEASKSVQAMSHAYLSATWDSLVSDSSSLLQETDVPQGKSSHDVESWLHSLGLESVKYYVQLFHEHHLDMSRVQLLSASDLREMGIHAIGPIMKIMKGVLVLGRDKDLLCGSCDHSNNGDKQRQYGNTNARSMDNHIDTNDLTEMSTTFSHGLKNGADNNNMCKLEHCCDKSFTKELNSPVFYTQEPGQVALVNNLADDKLVKMDLGTTDNLKCSDHQKGSVFGVSHVVGEKVENSRPKKTVNKRQAAVTRRTKEPALGVYGKPPVCSNGITVSHKFHMKDKRIQAKEANGRSTMRQKQMKEEILEKCVQRRQSSSLHRFVNIGRKSALERSLSFSSLDDMLVELQDSEFDLASVELQRNKTDGLEKELFAVCKLQSHLHIPEKQSAESAFSKLKTSNLELDSVEPTRDLHSLELSPMNNCSSGHESVSSSSTKRRDAQERKQQQDKMKQSIVDEEERLLSDEAYICSDNQIHKLSTIRSQYKDLQITQELPGRRNFNRQELVNDSSNEKNGENYATNIVIGGHTDAIDTGEIQKVSTVAQPVTVMAAETHLLKPKRSWSASLRNKDNGQLRRQKSMQSEKCKRAGSSQGYILDNFKKVELNRHDVKFSEKDLLGSGTFSQVFKGTYQGSDVAVKRLQIPLQTRDLNYLVSEISALQELRHPHVIMLLGVCSRSDKLPLIIMELLACGSLHTRLHGPARTDLKRDEVYQIAHDVSAGMLYLHNHWPQVLHLDLKPKNILIGHGARAKVADFGFTKLRLKDVKLHHTRESPTWMAPELFTSGEITPKADVYSFGMVLWEMLTRQYPYENFSVFQIMESVQANRRPALPPDCPKELSQIVQKCWHQNPAARPGFKEILKCLEQLSQTCNWKTSPEAAAEHGNQIINFPPEYARVIDYSLKEGQLKVTDKTPNIDRIDLISLSSHDYEENNSCQDGEGKSLSDFEENDPEKGRFCDKISLTDSQSGIQAVSDSKNSLCSAEVEQPKFSLQLGSSRSCLSLPDNEKDIEKMRLNTADKLNELYLSLTKSGISVSKSQDSLRSSMSVKKLLPLRNSLDRSKVMPFSFQGKGFKPQIFLHPQTKRQRNQHCLDEDIPGRMCGFMDTSSDFVKDPALSGSRELIKGQDTLDSISVKEDVPPAPNNEALPYVPSFHDKVMLVRLTTRQEPSGLNAGCCHESSDNNQSRNRLKESLCCSHVQRQPVNTFMNSRCEPHHHTSIEAPNIILAAGNLDLGNTKTCRMHDMNKDSQIDMLSPLRQISEILKTPTPKQVEANRCHMLDKNIPNEKEITLDRKKADVCFLAERLKSYKLTLPSSGGRVTEDIRDIHCSTNITDCENIHSLLNEGESVDIHAQDQCSLDPAQTEIVPEGRLNPGITVLKSQDDYNSSYLHKHINESDIETPSIRSSTIHTASAGSDYIPTSSRSDDMQKLMKSGNMATHSARSYNLQLSVSDNVQITSARSDNLQTLTRLGFSEMVDYSTESTNHSISLSKGHETTTYESDSDSSTISDISQDSLNKDPASSPRVVKISDIFHDSLIKDAAACPKAVKILQHNDLARSTSSALLTTTDILQNKTNELLIADNLNTENSSACNPCLTDHEGIKAQQKYEQSGQKHRSEVANVSVASTDAKTITYNKIHNTVHDHFNGCLWPEVRQSYHVRSSELAKPHEKMLQKEFMLKEKEKSNIAESKKDPQLEEVEEHNSMPISLSQKRNFLTKLQSGMGTCVSGTSFVLHNAGKAKDLLPLHSKQLLKHSEGTSRFSIDANILITQKKLLKPVVSTTSSFSINTLDESEDRSPTVITILKKAMADRRFAMRDILESQESTPETSWSLEG